MSAIKSHEAWAVVISAIALVVSGLTWLDVRQQLRLSAGQLRAYVQVVDVKLVEPIFDEPSFIKLDIKIKNLGQTAAIDVHGEMDYRLGSPESSGEGNEATRRPFGAMGPGMERNVTLQSNRFNRHDWPAPRPRGESVYFFGTVWYTDDTTHQKRKEDWCYSLPLIKDTDLKRTDLQPCDVLNYTSKNRD